jgi:exodeoxyribonuclease-1
LAEVHHQATVEREGLERSANQLTGDGTGCLTYEQALAETDKLLAEAIDADGLLAQYRLYLQVRIARYTVDFRASEMRESP